MNDKPIDIEYFLEKAANANLVKSTGADLVDSRQEKSHSIFFRKIEIDERDGFVCPPKLLVTKTFELTEMDMAQAKNILQSKTYRRTLHSAKTQGTTLQVTALSAYGLQQLKVNLKLLSLICHQPKRALTISTPSFFAKFTDEEHEVAEPYLHHSGLIFHEIRDGKSFIYKQSVVSKAA